MRKLIALSLFVSSLGFGQVMVGNQDEPVQGVATLQASDSGLIDEIGDVVGPGTKYGYVTVWETKNGTTVVSCTGGCTFNRGWFGTSVCDRDNVCIDVGGRVIEKIENDKTK